MARVIAPSVWLTGRLSFTRKYLLIGLVVALALAALSVPLWQKVRQDRRLAELERTGLRRFVLGAQVLARVVALRDDMLEPAEPAPGSSSPGASAAAAQARTASAAGATELSTALQRVIDAATTNKAAAQLRQRWQQYQAVDPTAGAQQRFATLNGVVNSLLTLLQTDAQAHRLTADPELDLSFALLTGRLPALIDTLGKQQAAARQRDGEFAPYALGVQVFLTEAVQALREGLAPLLEPASPAGSQLLAALDALLAGIAQQQDAADKTLDDPAAWHELSTLAVRNEALAQHFLHELAALVDARLDARIGALLRTEWIIGALLAAALLAMSYLFAGMYVSTQRSLHRLRRGTEAFIAGRLDQRVRIDTQDELVQVAANFNTLAEAFARLLDRLREQNESRERELASLVQARTAELAERNEELRQAGERARDELLLARDMQQAILTQDFPTHPDWAVYACMNPALELGGDFYDVYELPDGRCGVLVADVSGKGAAAALFMAVSRTLLLDLAASGLGPAAVLAQANEQLCRHNPMDMFVTVCCGIYDPRDGSLVYACAGHPAPLCQTTLGEAQFLPTDHDMALGVIAGMTFAERHAMLAQGATLLLYTDGVTEAFDAAGEAFGDARLRAWFSRSHSALGAQGLVQALVAEVNAFVGTAQASDDLTCLVLTRCTPPSESPPSSAAAAGDVSWVTAPLPAARPAASVGSATLVAAAADLTQLDPPQQGDVDMPVRPPVVDPSDKVLLLEHSLPARLVEIERLADAVSEVLPERPDLAFSANLCLEELITNIIHHGLAGESDRLIRVRLSMSPEWLEIILKDDAPPFDPFHQVGEPDLDANVDDRSVGGLGVHLVKTLMDDARAYYDGSGNLIVLLKTLKRAGASADDAA
jgi:serine phosphatase RsbU (regulator of sigma subunit)/anti-sigma regulatory factor (Ser/Thr protein kinase)